MSENPTSSSASSSSATASKQTAKITASVEKTYGVEKPTNKDRIKTPDQFQIELNLLMAEHLKHTRLAEEKAESFAKLKTLRTRVVPFMLHNLEQVRADDAAHGLYLSSTLVERNRKVKTTDIYTIIEKLLGPANVELIRTEAAELAKQRVVMRQTRILPIAKKKRKAGEVDASANATEPANTTNKSTKRSRK